MIRVIKTKFSATKETLDLLFACNRISAQIWNEFASHCERVRSHQQLGLD